MWTARTSSDERPPELDGLDDGAREAGHRDDDAVALPRRLEDLPGPQGQLLLDGVVLAADERT